MPTIPATNLVSEDESQGDRKRQEDLVGEDISELATVVGNEIQSSGDDENNEVVQVQETDTRNEILVHE